MSQDGSYGVLVVEDERPVSGMLRALVRAVFGVNADLAEDCATARKYIQENAPYTLIVCDGYLPDGRGPELYVEFRERFMGSGVTFMVHSGNKPETWRDQFPVLVEDEVPVLLKANDDVLEILEEFKARFDSASRPVQALVAQQ